MVLALIAGRLPAHGHQPVKVLTLCGGTWASRFPRQPAGVCVAGVERQRSDGHVPWRRRARPYSCMFRAASLVTCGPKLVPTKQTSDLEIQAREVMRIRTSMEEILAQHTGQNRDRIRADIDRDTILTGPDALAYGLADQVLPGTQAASTGFGELNMSEHTPMPALTAAEADVIDHYLAVVDCIAQINPARADHTYSAPRADQALAAHAVGLRDALALMFERGEDSIHATTPSAAPCNSSTPSAASAVSPCPTRNRR